ncbi:MAG TPA: sugar phosphate isomerase/epimerase family protein [Phycisphaerae bacterium]|jgi:sugar phosphate isomerase/epimerase
MSDLQIIPAALALDGLGDIDARAAFDVAAGSAYRGIAFATNHRELNPDALGDTARRHVRTILAGKHLQIESVRAAAPRGGLADTATIDRTLDNTLKAMNLARALGVKTVSLNVGRLGDAGGGAGGGGVPEETVVAALRQLAQQADSGGLTLALSSGGDAQTLGRVLKQVDFDHAKINLETAALIADGHDPLKSAEMLAGLIGQMTAADALRSGKSARSVMLGEGQLPLQDLLEMLKEQGFDGPLVVDVRDLPDGAAGARHAAEVLRRLLFRQA